MHLLFWKDLMCLAGIGKKMYFNITENVYDLPEFHLPLPTAATHPHALTSSIRVCKSLHVSFDERDMKLEEPYADAHGKRHWARQTLCEFVSGSS